MTVKHRVRTREEQNEIRRSFSFADADDLILCSPAVLHIPGCRKPAVRGIELLVALGGPNLIPFPVLRTREPRIYRDHLRICHRWHERGAQKAPVIDLHPPAPAPVSRKPRAPRQVAVAR